MKSAAKTVNFLLVLFAIILGIVIIVNLFLPGTFAQLEGFREGNKGNVSQKSQTTNITNCTKTNKAIDDWFVGKTMANMKDFFNESTGTFNRKKFPIADQKGDNCENYIKSKIDGVKKNSSSKSDSSSSESDSSSSKSSSSSDNNDERINSLEKRVAKLEKSG